MTEHPNAIVFENLFRWFGKNDEVVAIDNLSASIKSGIITGLVGPDGAGKTTLIRMIAGLLTPSKGTLKVNGLDPAAQGDALREAGVGRLRLSPCGNAFTEVVALFDAVFRQGKDGQEALAEMRQLPLPGRLVDGFARREPGLVEAA